jgi:site-specific recombinase XerD
MVVVLWRSGVRISEALALAESDLDNHLGAIVVRQGKGGRRREVGMDRWAWDAWTAMALGWRMSGENVDLALRVGASRGATSRRKLTPSKPLNWRRDDFSIDRDDSGGRARRALPG